MTVPIIYCYKLAKIFYKLTKKFCENEVETKAIINTSAKCGELIYKEILWRKEIEKHILEAVILFGFLNDIPMTHCLARMHFQRWYAVIIMVCTYIRF